MIFDEFFLNLINMNLMTDLKVYVNTVHFMLLELYVLENKSVQ